MSDQLKKYIQQSKHQLDLKNPKADLFDKILNQLESNKRTQVTPKKASQLKIGWFALAASFLLLLSIGLVFDLTTKNSPEATSQIVNHSSLKLPESEKKFNASSSNIKPSMGFEKQDSKSNAEMKFESRLYTSQKQTYQNSVSNAKFEVKSAYDLENEQSLNIGSKSNTLISTSEIILENQNSITDLSTTEDTKNELADQNSMKPLTTPPVVDNSSYTEKAEAINSIKGTANISQNQSLKSALKKGFFNFVSKKAKEWTGDNLSIENIDKNDRPVLAIHYKNETVEFSKSIHLKSVDR